MGKKKRKEIPLVEQIVIIVAGNIDTEIIIKNVESAAIQVWHDIIRKEISVWESSWVWLSFSL